MRWKAKLKAPRIDLTAYQQRLHVAMTEIIAHAAFEWLSATTVLIPVWSGASLATFQQLANEISFQTSIVPVPSAPDRISLGLSNSEGHLTLNEGGKYDFTYSTSLRHLIFNEFNNANIVEDPHVFARLLTPGPYHFQEAGRSAYERFAQNASLPTPFESLKIHVFNVR